MSTLMDVLVVIASAHENLKFILSFPQAQRSRLEDVVRLMTALILKYLLNTHWVKPAVLAQARTPRI